MHFKDLFGRWVRDVRFWIVVLALLRLYGITNAPLEVEHSWRQTTVAMAARNFYEVDNNILYPRIDISEDLTGITGMEFPLLNYLIYIMALVFGYSHWYGRLINLIVTSVGVYYFYRLVRKYGSERCALFSALLLNVSIWFAYGRKIMPDTFSMSLVIMGMYYGSNYLEQLGCQAKNLVLYALLTTLGVLSKLPSGFALVLFAFPVFDRKIALRGKVVFCAVSAAMLVPVVWWYYYWVSYLLETYGIWHFFMGKSFAESAVEIGQNLTDTLAHFYDDAMKFIGFGVFVIGMVRLIADRQRRWLLVFAAGFAAFLVVVFKSGWTFAHHDYYIVPFVPLMAAVAGYGLSRLKRQWLAVVLLVAVGMENILNQHTHFMIKDSRAGIQCLEKDMDAFSSKGDLIVVNSGEDPTAVYFAHRKGWVASNEQLADSAFRADLRNRGCRYAVILQQAFGTDMPMEGQLMKETADYKIYAWEEE